MRAHLTTPLLALTLLGACAQPQYLYSEPAAAIPGAVSSQRMSLHIGNGFSSAEQAKIRAAVDEWNQAGNGGVRFDVASATGGAAMPGAWTIEKPDGAAFATSDEWRPRPVADIRRFAGGGGSIVLHTNRLGHRDLRALVGQELGKAVGDPVPVAARAREGALGG